MGDSLSALEGKTETAAPAHGGTGDSLSRLEASTGPNTTGAQPDKPYAPSAGKWYSGADDIANAGLDVVKGAVKSVIHGRTSLDNVLHPDTAPSRLPEILPAIHDIRQSADPTETFLDVAQKTAAQGGAQALLALGGEGLTKISGPAVETTARTAGKLAKGVAEDIPVVRQATKVVKYAKEAAAETAARRAPVPAEAPSFPTYDKAPATPTSVTPESATPAVHPDAAEFEKTFGQPIDNYVDKAGKLNTPDFLNDIVKPKTQSPNDVINRTFGADGVDLVKKLNGGKYLDKWESNDPARANASVSGGSGAATLEKTSEVPARGYLKKVGADEGSILNGVGRTPGEHADSVNYHREQIRAGTSTPSELHVDQDGNVIGADGRHRALAAIQEQGPDAKIKVRVVQHRFQGVE